MTGYLRSTGERKVNALRELLRVDPYAGVSAVEVLKRTPLDQLEQTVGELKKHRSVAEVRGAMVEHIARASLADFEAVKYVYLKHCGDPAK
jgi:hypothetical protein